MEKELSNALTNMQEKVIGVLKHHGIIEMIIEKNEHSFKTIDIGNFLGLHTNHYPIDYDNGRIIMFPNEKTLSQLMADPFEFQKWYDDNKL